MSPFKSSAGRQLGKMLEGFKSSDVGKGFGAGGAAAGGDAQATGGEVLLGTSYVDGNKTYKYHYFKSPGSFIMPEKATFDGDLDVLVVAGGGSGGNRSGGGAGAGGIAVGQNVAFPGTGQLSVPITVGNGGSVSGAAESRGNNGQDSRFGDAPDPYSVVAHGGGYGGGDGNTTGGGGGSGGGAHYDYPGGTASQPGANPGKSWVTNYGSPGGRDMEHLSTSQVLVAVPAALLAMLILTTEERRVMESISLIGRFLDTCQLQIHIGLI